MRTAMKTIGMALAAAVLLMTPAVGEDGVSLVQRVDTLQARVDHYLAQEPERVTDFRSDEAYAELIERLELGMAALKELRKEDALHALERIADGVREERQAAQRARRQKAARSDQPRVRDEAKSEIDVVRGRLKVMRLAVDAYVKAGDVAAAERVEYAMHARELAIEGRRDAKATKIREQAPDRAELAALLRRASGLYAEWGHEKKAAVLIELAQTFHEQARRIAARTGRSDEREAEAPAKGLDDLKVRLEIVRYALGAHAEAGHVDARDILERLLVVGEMQAAGVGEESIAKAAEGLSMGTIIELLQGATGLYKRWEKPERARACNQLAEFYARRERERAGGEEERTTVERDLRRLQREEQAARDSLEGIRPQHSRYELRLRQVEELEQQRREVEAAQVERTDRDAMLRRVANRVEELQAELNELKQVLRKLNAQRR